MKVRVGVRVRVRVGVRVRVKVRVRVAVRVGDRVGGRSRASFLAAAFSCSVSSAGSLASPFHMVSGAGAVPAGWRSGMPESNSGVSLADSSACGAGEASARSLLAATWSGLG